jgi:SAM-dependent methyltransferase
MEYETTHVVDIYNKIASEFNVTRTYNWSWIDKFMNNIPKGSLIYDIGCGNGRNMQYIDHKFIGIDNCIEFIKMCRNKQLNTIYANMNNIPLSSQSTNYIICIATFHHLQSYKNRLNALLEMKRLLKPGGKILLSVWSKVQPRKTRVIFNNYGDNIVLWKNIHKRYYYIFKIDEIIQLFKDAELILEEHKYDCGNEIFTLTY